MARIELAHEADLIVGQDAAAALAQGEDALRDYVDLQTGSDLDCFQLDTLTDMVAARVRKAVRS